MRVYRTLDFLLDGVTCVALGCFDGVHLGHREVIGRAKKAAEKTGALCAVFTFEAPPRNYFVPQGVPLLSSVEDKLAIFESLGVDICVCLPLSEKIFNMDAISFVEDIIFGNMRAKAVVCGYNYSFGKGGAGNSALIKKLAKGTDIEVFVIPEQKIGKQTVSSSLIREKLQNGEAERAAELLGRPYALSAKVVDGQHLARTLGFPTVNIIPDAALLLPAAGVYVSRICFDGACYYGITNVGIRPTVGTQIKCAETHIFDFEGNLYGKTICVELLHFLRHETRFESVEVMAKQIKKDIVSAKEYVNKNI